MKLLKYCSMAKSPLTLAELSDVDLTDVSGQMWISNSTFTGDVMFTDNKGRDFVVGDLIDRIDALEERLAILQEPSPEILAKHEMLKDAYKRYKFIEKLIGKDGD